MMQEVKILLFVEVTLEVLNRLQVFYFIIEYVVIANGIKHMKKTDCHMLVAKHLARLLAQKIFL